MSKSIELLFLVHFLLQIFIFFKKKINIKSCYYKIKCCIRFSPNNNKILIMVQNTYNIMRFALLFNKN